MAGGFIPALYVKKVTLSDGLIVHFDDPKDELRNFLDSNYVWQKDERRWRFDPLSLKRKHSDKEDSNVAAFKARQKQLQREMKAGRILLNAIADKLADDFSCEECAHKPTKEHLREKVVNLFAKLDISALFKSSE